MLKGVPAILSPELLAILRSMGHGDEVVIVDANFPAASCAKQLIRLDGVDATTTLDAVLQLLPLDSYAEAATFTMGVVNGNGALAPIATLFSSIIELRSGKEFADIVALERYAFYERAREAFAIIVTGEARLYGNLILKKGVIDPEAK